MNQKKLLIVSNNPISLTDNNGKTIASFIDGIKKENIRQLYFNPKDPSIDGYSYYQLSDFDILKGFFNENNRGHIYNLQKLDNTIDNITKVPDVKNVKIKKDALERLVREIIWFKHWKSKKLVEWLDEFNPDVVFFVAGDSGFAYSIVDFIVRRYSSKLVTYVTDDYIMPRTKESFLEKIRRKYIKNKMVSCIDKSENYFTISSIMKKEYKKLTNKDSHIIMNATKSMKIYNDEDIVKDDNFITFIYTGSLYYGRDKIIGLVADAAKKYNDNLDPKGKKIIIKVYTNSVPSEESKKKFCRHKLCDYYGSLDSKELKIELNRADILLFIESFDIEMKERTRYSLSTKVPEYMSVGKPIFAVGPADIGSMDYLEGISFCAHNEEDVFPEMAKMLSSKDLMQKKANVAFEKYQEYNDPEMQKNIFISNCLL